eukprot:scaffold380103_cov33-Prasinocladus_malaysianus.AAC.1
MGAFALICLTPGTFTFSQYVPSKTTKAKAKQGTPIADTCLLLCEIIAMLTDIARAIPYYAVVFRSSAAVDGWLAMARHREQWFQPVVSARMMTYFIVVIGDASILQYD